MSGAIKYEMRITKKINTPEFCANLTLYKSCVLY